MLDLANCHVSEDPLPKEIKRQKIILYGKGTSKGEKNVKNLINTKDRLSYISSAWLQRCL